MKYYQKRGCSDEIVYSLEHWKHEAEDRQQTIVLELQKRIKSGGEGWCIVNGEMTISNESCGNLCQDYDPRNGKNGCCRNYKQMFTDSGKLYTVSKGGQVRQIHTKALSISQQKAQKEGKYE